MKEKEYHVRKHYVPVWVFSAQYSLNNLNL